MVAKSRKLRYNCIMKPCPKCKHVHCGNDNHTKSRILIERNVGDRMKIIAKMVEQFMDQDNLQMDEIASLVCNYLNNHITEYDEANGTYTKLIVTALEVSEKEFE